MPLPVHARLMVHTAEMLALPHLVCRRRDCRRKNACHWHFKPSGEPCCLRNLTAAQRQLFDELAEQARLIHDHGGRHGLMYAWGDADERASLDAANGTKSPPPCRVDRSRRSEQWGAPHQTQHCSNPTKWA